MSKVAKSLHKNFKNKFINKKYSFNGRNGINNFCEMPISNHIGRVSIVSNSYNIEPSLDELINLHFDKDIHGRIIEYNNEAIKYGGLDSILSDIKDLVNFNKYNLTLIHPSNSNNILNLFTPGSDILNINFKDSLKYGCHLISMNYQIFDDKMKDYINFFKKSPLILKPDNLRYIAKPKPIVFKQYSKLSYAPRKLEQDGWFKHKI